MNIGFCTQLSISCKFTYVFILQLDIMGHITPEVYPLNNPQCSLRNWGKIEYKQPNSGGVDQKEKYLYS